VIKKLTDLTLARFMISEDTKDLIAMNQTLPFAQIAEFLKVNRSLKMKWVNLND